MTYVQDCIDSGASMWMQAVLRELDTEALAYPNAGQNGQEFAIESWCHIWGKIIQIFVWIWNVLHIDKKPSQGKQALNSVVSK